jgi:hypothetical protein
MEGMEGWTLHSHSYKYKVNFWPFDYILMKEQPSIAIHTFHLLSKFNGLIMEGSMEGMDSTRVRKSH